ncbi:hypothetical protein BpHYR1_005479 [Brachionus plicatilis]|uniref:Uncharacterized protein n=1 Tax=Brachionus plicatilis TaxID=10195 RepID=A0A3M7S2X3_BRAPC|nr:hypothetical protein BpHYR1_005479 [Brachionus plicatilis]
MTHIVYVYILRFNRNSAVLISSKPKKKEVKKFKVKNQKVLVRKLIPDKKLRITVKVRKPFSRIFCSTSFSH